MGVGAALFFCECCGGMTAEAGRPAGTSRSGLSSSGMRLVEHTPWSYTRQIASLLRMEIREIFARNLRAARQVRRLSQEELAHRAGLDRTYISSLERSVYTPTIDVVDRLAKAMDMDLLDLLRREPSHHTG